MIRYGNRPRHNYIAGAPAPAEEKPDMSRVMRGKRRPDDPNVKRKPKERRPKLHPLPDKV